MKSHRVPRALRMVDPASPGTNLAMLPPRGPATLLAVDNDKRQVGEVGTLVGLTVGMFGFVVFGLVDEGGEIIWWLLSMASLVVVLSGLIRSVR